MGRVGRFNASAEDRVSSRAVNSAKPFRQKFTPNHDRRSFQAAAMAFSR
jgi:hypothetical protein